jgi:hypothetical protein
MSVSFISQILEPGGGVILLPFVRVVVAMLLVLTMTAAVVNVARIHMIILSVLATGLLASLSFFEIEFKKMRSRVSYSDTSSSNQSQSGGAHRTSGSTLKTD